MTSNPPSRRDPVRLFLWWSLAWAVLLRAFFLGIVVYFGIEADLSNAQIVLLGTGLEIAVLVSEIPTGVVADTISRKLSLVIGHLVMGVGVILTGSTDSFGLLLLSQMIWGCGWTFTSGADVAWITDELNDESRIDGVLTKRARWQQYGAIIGYALFGLVAWASDMARALQVAGVASIVLGLIIAVVFTEHGFQAHRENKLAASKEIFLTGTRLVRSDRALFLVLLATLLLNAGAEAIDRLYPTQLQDAFGLGDDPIVPLTILSIVGFLVGALILWRLESRIDRPGMPGRVYAGAAALAAVGTIFIAFGPGLAGAVVGVFLVRGIAWAVIGAVATAWVNRRAPSEARATVNSFLGQAESIGEVNGGIALAIVAESAGIPTAFVVSAALFALTAVVVARSPARADSATAV